jgi:DNA-directed RNA polymerase specialized sigma24 family protein
VRIDLVADVADPKRVPERRARPSVRSRAARDPGDATLVRRVCAGDRDALAALHDRHGRAAYSLARHVCADDDVAADVVQEVFLAFWREPRRSDPVRRPFGTWLLTLVQHACVDVVRTDGAARRRPLSAVEGGGTALGRLPVEQRRALALAYYGGYTQREVAALTGAPAGTVQAWMSVGVQRLRAAPGRGLAGAAAGGPGCRRTEGAAAWALHALEPDEELQYREHLTACAACQEAVRDAEEALAALGASTEQVDPPPALRESLLIRAAGIRQLLPPDPADDADPRPLAPPLRMPAARPRIRRSNRSARPAGRLVVVAVVLVAAVTVGSLAAGNAQLRQQRDAEAARARDVTELLDELTRPGARHAVLSSGNGDLVAAVVVAGEHHEVFPVGMAPNAAGATTYVLWGIADHPRPLGTFDVGGPAARPRTVSAGGGGAAFTAYAISLEPGRAAPAAPSLVLAQGPVET